MRAARPLVVLTVWVLIAGIALHSTLGTADVHFMEAADPFVAAFSRFVWIPAPFVIAGIEIVRMWLATSPARPR